MNRLLYILLFFTCICFSQADESLIDPEIALAKSNSGWDVAHEYTGSYPSWVLRVVYVSANGNSGNTGASEASPLDIKTALETNLQAGDYVWVKTGDYDGWNNSTRQGSDSDEYHQIRFGASGTASNHIAVVGYNNVIGDLDRGYGQRSTFTDAMYATYPQNANNTRELPTNIMPTFSGDLNSGKYIDNQSMFFIDNNTNYIIIKNIAGQYFRRFILVTGADYIYLDNINGANHGWFVHVAGQGGGNSDLQGSTINFFENCQYVEVQNSWSYNVTFRAFTFSDASYPRVEYSSSTSDVDEGNPQDYYFHFTGDHAYVNQVYVDRAASSDHSGHGICFNQESAYCLAENSTVKGTELHLDGASHCKFSKMTMEGYPSFGPLFRGGGLVLFDDVYNCVLEDITGVELTDQCIVIKDTGSHAKPPIPPREVAAEDITFRRLDYTSDTDTWGGTTLAIKYTSSGVTNVPLDDILIEDSNFRDMDEFMFVGRQNSGLTLDNVCVTNVPVFVTEENSYTLNSDTVLNNVNFDNAQVPSGYSQTNTTTNANCNALGATSVTGVSLTPTDPTVNLSNGTIQFTATIAPNNATNQNLTWSTSNATVAEVDANGLVTLIGEGTTTINVVAQDGNFSDPQTLTVTNTQVGRVIKSRNVRVNGKRIKIITN